MRAKQEIFAEIRKNKFAVSFFANISFKSPNFNQKVAENAKVANAVAEINYPDKINKR